MTDALTPDPLALLTAKPETAIAVLGAELRGSVNAILQRIDSVLNRQAASEARAREFELTARSWVDHETANRRMADDKLSADIASLDRKKVVEQPQLDALDRRYEEGIALVRVTAATGNDHAKRLDAIDTALDRRRLTERFIWSALAAAATAAGWAIKTLVDAGFIHA